MKNQKRKTDKTLMKKAQYILLSIVTVFSASHCKGTQTRLVVDKTVVNGGDGGAPATMENSTVRNIESTDAVVFIKSKESGKVYSAPTTVTKIEVAHQEVCPESGCPQPEPRPYLLAKKSILFGAIPTETMTIRKDQLAKNQDSKVPVSYQLVLTNVGSELISELTFVDALPAGLEVEKVSYYWTVYVGAAIIRDSNFDDMVWDIQNLENEKYLTLKMVMEKEPLVGATGMQSNLILKIEGRLAIE